MYIHIYIFKYRFIHIYIYICLQMPANKGGAATHAGEQQHHQDVCNSNYFAQTNTDRSNYHVSYMRSAATKTIEDCTKAWYMM